MMIWPNYSSNLPTLLKMVQLTTEQKYVEPYQKLPIISFDSIVFTHPWFQCRDSGIQRWISKGHSLFFTHPVKFKYNPLYYFFDDNALGLWIESFPGGGEMEKWELVKVHPTARTYLYLWVSGDLFSGLGRLNHHGRIDILSTVGDATAMPHFQWISYGIPSISDTLHHTLS
jgi:hypothetical protein